MTIALGFGTSLSLGQSQILSPRMLQSLAVLQMSSAELLKTSI